MIRIAHLSDLHFFKPSWSLLQIFSKRWLGNLNGIFNRRRYYLNEIPFYIIECLKKEGVTHVIISGDLTTTSSPQEFDIAKEFILHIKNLNIKVFLIPGNHDHYTKRSYNKKVFYLHFPSKYSKSKSEIDRFTLKNHGVTSCLIKDSQWRIVMLDTSLSTSLISSQGLFSYDLEENLIKILNLIPSKERVILVNHFPFLKTKDTRRNLIGCDALKRVIASNKNISLYLHGHTHKNIIEDLRRENLPIVLDSGSAGYIFGSWNLITLTKSHIGLTSYKWDKQWRVIKNQSFHL